RLGGHARRRHGRDERRASGPDPAPRRAALGRGHRPARLFLRRVGLGARGGGDAAPALPDRPPARDARLEHSPARASGPQRDRGQPGPLLPAARPRGLRDAAGARADRGHRRRRPLLLREALPDGRGGRTMAGGLGDGLSRAAGGAGGGGDAVPAERMMRIPSSTLRPVEIASSRGTTMTSPRYRLLVGTNTVTILPLPSRLLARTSWARK